METNGYNYNAQAAADNGNSSHLQPTLTRNSEQQHVLFATVHNLGH